MPYTVHTLDGQAHTYPSPCTARIADAGLLTLHEDVSYDGDPICSPLLAAYPQGQWTHYHVEPAPYETGTRLREDAGCTQCETQPDTTTEGKDKWFAEFQRHINAGRKAARAR